jgi:rhamnosyltransferase
MTNLGDNEFRKRISSCSIVVTYNPNPEMLLNLVGQIDASTDFILIDNNSSNLSDFRLNIDSLSQCKLLVSRENNLGLASALNFGLKWCMEHGYEFAFLFDQDSVPSDLFFENMLDTYIEIESSQQQKIAALGPRIVNPRNLKRARFKNFNSFFKADNVNFEKYKKHFHADFIITSGTLLRLEHLSEIGLMKESYFIDNIDLEWCFRARHRGFRIIGTDSAVLYHAIGEQIDSILVRSGIIVHHNPGRIYYSSRNRIHLWSVDYAPVGWKVRDIFRFILKTAFLLIFSADRVTYGKNIICGFKAVKALN